MSTQENACCAVALLGALAAIQPASAAPLTINTPFMNLEHRAINSLGFGSGEFLRVGANSVSPNGNSGTTGTASTVNLVTGATVSTRMDFFPSPLLPNLFASYMADNRALYGPWTMTFTHSGGGSTDTASRTVSLPLTAQQAPFVNSITLSGTSTNPTFSWTPPPGAVVNGYRVNIYDKGLNGPTNTGQVTSRNLLPGQTSYTVNAADFSVPGNALALGRQYSIEISLIQTKNGSSSNLSNDNLQAIARVYADFSPTLASGPVVNLPVVLANGSYQFNMTVAPGQTYYIDPLVAIGYDYAIGQGNPNFRTLDLPDDIGDGLYDIFRDDGLGGLSLLAHDWSGANVFDFGASGVSRFRVMGIETSAGLDPASTTAFVTGLTFTGAGQFTGTQTPISVDVDFDVGEPPTLGLAFLAFGIAYALRRRPEDELARIASFM